MQKITQRAVYNPRSVEMPCPLRSRWMVGALLVLAFGARLSATDWQAPAQRLAEKIVAITGPGAMAVEVTVRSSLSRPDSDAIRRTLLTNLVDRGVRIVKADQAAATVQVYLSEDLRNYVWIAQVRQGAGDASVVVSSLPRPDLPVPESNSSALALRKTHLWSQPGRILDVATMGGSPQLMIVLDADNITVYKFQEGHWQPGQPMAISHSRPWPRDLRGRLVLRQDHLFDAYLPGVLCHSLNTALPSIECAASDDPWPLGNWQANVNAFYASSRNFFTGALSPGIGKKTAGPAFYSAAMLPRSGYALWLFVGVDGQVHLIDGVTERTAEKWALGSDIASVRSGCGSGWQVLASGTADNGRGTVRAFEVADRDLIAAGTPVELSGMVTALWTDSDTTGAIAISQNSETGNYEAYRFNVTCGQ